MIEIFKTIIETLKSFFKWRSCSIKYNIYKDRRNKEIIKNRVKIRKQLRDLSKKGNIKDFLLILFLMSFVGCKSIEVYPIENYEGRYENLELLKTNINNINNKNINIWVLNSETLEKMIDNIYRKFELECN